MKEQMSVHERYLRFSSEILRKLRYEVNEYNDTAWKWLTMELICLTVYYAISLLTMAEPTIISLVLNFFLAFRFFMENCRKNSRIVYKATGKDKTSKDFASVHALIAMVEAIAIGLMLMMIICLGIKQNIGQKQFVIFVVTCISFLEGWKNISVSFFEATPKVF